MAAEKAKTKKLSAQVKGAAANTNGPTLKVSPKVLSLEKRLKTAKEWLLEEPDCQAFQVTVHKLEAELVAARPEKFVKLDNGKIEVFCKGFPSGSEVFDTVLMAMGRTGLGKELNLESAGVTFFLNN